MRKRLALCVALLLLTGWEAFVFAAPKPLVELAAPADSIDWERKPATPGCPARLESDYGRGLAVVQVLVMPDTPGDLSTVADKLAETMERGIGDEPRRATREGKLNGVACRIVDVRTERQHVTWELARRGKRLYVLHVRRAGDAMNDPGVAAEIASIRASFRFLEKLAAPVAPRPPAPPPPPAPAKDYDLTYWRLRVRKPEGFVEKKLDAGETGGNVILRFDATQDQARCMIRVYAYAKGTAGYPTIPALQKSRIDSFEKRYAKREEARAIKGRWKIPRARRTARLELVGKRRVTERIHWYFAECRNGRLYAVEIHLAGPQAPWQAGIDAFLRDFTPLGK